MKMKKSFKLKDLERTLKVTNLQFRDEIQPELYLSTDANWCG